MTSLHNYLRIRVVYIMCLLSLLLAAVPELMAQVRVHGTVTDEKGQPMDIVHVRLLRTAVGTTTNFKGEYEFAVPEADTLRVIFTSLGYRRVEKVVNTRQVRPNTEGQRRLLLNVQMRPNEAVLGDVEVTAQRQTTPGNMEHLQVEDVRLMRTASGNAVEDMIGTMAGVNMNNELSSQYNVRGGSFDENLVYVNGIEVYRPQLIASGQQEGLSFINPSMVGAIDFSTGGFTAEYGDKMSSVLDITYRRPDSLDYEATLAMTGASAALGQRRGAFTQLHGLRYKRNSTILNSLDTHGEYDPIFFDYQTFLTYTFGQRQQWDLTFLGNIAINDYRFTPESRETTFGTSEVHHSFKVYFDGHEKDRFDTYFGALTLGYNGLKNTKLQLMASAFMTDERVTYDIAGEYWMDQAASVSSSGLGVGRYMQHARNYLQASVMALQLKGVTQLGHNRLSYGLSAQSERISDKIAEWERRDSVGYSLPRDEGKLRVVENLHSAYRGTSTRLALFVQDQYGWDALDGRFLLQAGVRLSHWTFNGEWLLSPRASLRYTYGAERNRMARLAAGLYYQSPFYREYRLSYTDGDGNQMVEMNRSIRSQRSWQVIAGWDYTFRAYDRPFKFTAEAYYKGISDYIPYTVDNVQIRYLGTNTGHAYVTGVDAKIFGQFVDGTDSWLSLSLMKSPETYDEPSPMGGSAVRLTTSRPTEQRYGVGLFFSDYYPGHPDWRVFLRGVFNDGLPFSSPEGGRRAGVFRTAAYKRVDLGATHAWTADNTRFMRQRRWRWMREVTLGLDIFNLLDIDNTNSYYWVTVIGDDGSTAGNPTYAVPNYLTGRMINVSLGVRF